jgi:hypothetical protein
LGAGDAGRYIIMELAEIAWMIGEGDTQKHNITRDMHSDGEGRVVLEKSGIPGDEETFNNGEGGQAMIKTRIFASISKENAYEKGEQIGLSGEALNMFKYFNEVELEIKIDDDGVVRKIKAIL